MAHLEVLLSFTNLSSGFSEQFSAQEESVKVIVNVIFEEEQSNDILR